MKNPQAATAPQMVSARPCCSPLVACIEALVVRMACASTAPVRAERAEKRRRLDPAATRERMVSFPRTRSRDHPAGKGRGRRGGGPASAMVAVALRRQSELITDVTLGQLP